MKKRDEIKVSVCRQCPFFTTEGMEHMMLCNHPHWEGKGAYAGAIITHDNRDGIPEQCPLRRGTFIMKLRVKLEGLR